jgi:hypothetical protein
MHNRERAAGIVLALFVWGLAGALFGSLFVGLYQVLVFLGLQSWQSLIFAAAAAAGTTSAFYSAMPVALVGAMAGVLASIGYLMASGHRVQLLVISGIGTAAGVVAGGFYSWMSTGSGRPLAETLTGLFAGVTAGGLLWMGLRLYGGEVGMFALAAGVVALVGSIFKLAEGRIVGALASRLPRALSAPVVAGLIAAVVGASVWIMGGTTAWSLDAATTGIIERVLGEMPAGFLGGMTGGAITGAFLELMGVHLEEDEHVV